MFSSSLLAVPVSRDPRVTCCDAELSTLITNPQYFMSGWVAILEVKDGWAHIIRLLSCKSKMLARCLEQYCWRWKMNTHQCIIRLLSCKSKMLARCLEQYCWRWKMNTHQYIIRLLSCRFKILVRCLEQYCWRWKMDNNNNSVRLSCAHQRPERSHDTY